MLPKVRRAAAVATAGTATVVVPPLLVTLSDEVVTAAAAPAAGYDALLAGVALVGAWLVAARLAAAVVAVLVATLPGAVGLAGRRAAERLTPRLLRGALRVVLGAAVVGAPLALAPAAQADGAPGGGVPVLDRVPAAAAASAPPPAPAPAVRVAAAADVVVRPGDSLWRIAERSLPAAHTTADVAREWPRWYAANRAVVGPDPSLIRPGQVLRPPPAVGATAPAGSTERRSR